MKTGIYWERRLQTPSPTECELVELDAQLMPAVLSGLAGRMGPSHWESEEAYREGYRRLSRQGAALMLGCKEDLIVELRSLRDATPTHQPYDTATFAPGMYPGASMAELVNLLYLAPNSAAELLTQIRDLLQAQGQGSADQLEALSTIITLLA